MGEPIATPGAVEPDEWFVIFHTKSTSRWLSLFAAGRFKHVSALGYYQGFKAWLLFDPQWSGLRLTLISHETAKATIAQITDGCAIVKMPRLRQPMPLSARLAFYCVPAIKHLLGVRCATMRPDAFYRHILRRGGVLIDGRKPASDSGRPEPSD